ncbi:MAG: energy transducer TonB [Vicinamibacterales bacterium]
MTAGDAVTGVIAARDASGERWAPVVAFSIALHALLVAAVLLLPMADQADDVPRTVMTISLGGTAGPRTGGMTPMGGKEVQAVRQPEERRAETPPAAKPPEMTLPSKTATVRPKREVPKQAAKDATARRLSAGEEVQEGSARADTGARGQGFGLTGGGGSGTGAYLDVGDFCCPEYLETVMQVIQRNWVAKQGLTGQTLMKFTVLRTGQLTAVQVERPSGFAALDMAAQRALLLTARVPPLPAAFSNPDLTIHLRFDYQR